MVVFRGFLPTSLVDWDGKIVAVLYLPGCNFRCPFCQNSGLILHPENLEPIHWEKVEDYLKKNKDFLDGVCITGGEPMLQRGLPRAIRKIREMGLEVKIDTNGTNPSMLSSMIKEGLVDYVAMDIKAPLDERYYKVAGAEVDLAKIKKSIRMLIKSDIGYEFRTTVLPKFHDAKEVEAMAQAIEGAKKYVLQQFVPRNTLDPQYEDEEKYLPEDLQELATAASPYVGEVRVRGV